MSDSVSVGILVAFTAGLLSFLSPCVLPLVPSYIGFLTGMTAPDAMHRRRITVLHALFFVLGFTLVFLALGAGASAFGAALKSQKLLVARIGGVLIILFGLWTVGVLDTQTREWPLRPWIMAAICAVAGLIFEWLTQYRYPATVPPVRQAAATFVAIATIAFVITVERPRWLWSLAFAAGWVPCIGPILGTILGLAATQGDFSRGMALLVAYSAGLAIPFLLAAFALDAFLDWFKGFRRHLGTVKLVSGLLLIAVGILLVSGEFTRLAGWLSSLTPEFLRRRI
jgi:cytochrome c-type biogenesis protein